MSQSFTDFIKEHPTLTVFAVYGILVAVTTVIYRRDKPILRGSQEQDDDSH